MFKQKQKLIFILLLFLCIFLSMSFISANDNITKNESQFNDSVNEDNINDSWGEYVYAKDPIIRNYVIDYDNSSDTNNSINNTTNASKVINNKIDKSSVIVIAKKIVFNKKLKTKKYPVVLKTNNGKILKNTWVTLKIKGKLYKAKTNDNGKAIFKIKKLNKKGNYKGKIIFKGDNTYKGFTKKVTLIVK